MTKRTSLKDLDRPTTTEEEISSPGESVEQTVASPPAPGQAAVRNGALEIRGTALVIVPPELNVLVNGRRRQGTIAVRESDEVRIELGEPEPGQGFSVSITDDELSAVLRIHHGRLRRLRDAVPARPLLLGWEEVLLPPSGLTREAVEAELARLGVMHGTDASAIDEAVHKLPPGPVVIARGEPPEPGQPARVELFFENRIERQTVVRDDDTVDHRGLLRIPTVEAGDLLAKKISAQPGRPGRSVLGRKLPPPPQPDVTLTAGQGAEMEGSATVRAAVTGRPEAIEPVPGRYEIRVLPVLTHGTVDLSSGNVEFVGDVVIRGNVEESMSVVAGGNVTILGTVSRAYVEAGGTLRVLGNSFNSTLVAGGRSAFYAAERPLLERLAAALDTLKRAVDQLQQHPAFADILSDGARFAQLILLLVETRAQELPGLLRVLDSRLRVLERRDALSEGLCAFLARHLDKAGRPLFSGPTDVETLSAMVSEAIEIAREAPRDRSDVEARYLHNCRVEAMGSIRVGGEGSYHSNCHAGEHFRCAGPVLGGRVFGRHGVFVVEAGSRMGVVTEIETSAAGSVRVGRAFPRVVVRIGSRVYGLDAEQEGLFARMIGDELQVTQVPGRAP